MDDLKLSHVNPASNNELTKKLKKKHEKIGKVSMEVTGGKKHECLGILFDLGSKEEVKISMLDCTMKLIK